MDPPIPWEDWTDLLHLVIIAKENVDIENLLNPSERHHPLPLTLVNPTESESDNQRKTLIERKIHEQKRYDDEETTSINPKQRKLVE